MLTRFYWLIDDQLAGSSWPGGLQSRPGGLSEDLSLDNGLAWLCHQGVGAVLSLTETPIPGRLLERHSLEGLHLPVPDMTPPLPHQLHEALAFIDRGRVEGRPVVVHCRMGQGRTGVVLAAYLIRGGATAEEAIAEVRRRCIGAIESPGQEEALRRFAMRRDWLV